MKQKKKFKTFISCALVSAMLLSSSSSMMAEQIEVTETQEIYNRLFEAGSSVFVSEDDQSEYWPSMGIMPLLSTPTDGAWKKGANGKWWFEYTNKSYPANKWEVIDGYWYYFDGQGYMVTGDFYYPKDGKWYYLAPVKSTLYPEGAMVMDYWLKTTGEKWYYYGTDGALVTGNKTIAGVSYMFDFHGVCVNPNPPKSSVNTAMYVLTANDLPEGSKNRQAIDETIKHMRQELGKTTTFHDAWLNYPNYPRIIYEQLPYNELVVLHGHGLPGLLACYGRSDSNRKDLYASKNVTDIYEKSLDDYLPGQLSNVKLVYMAICESAKADSTGNSLASMLHNRGCKATIGWEGPISGGEYYGNMFFKYLGRGTSIEGSINRAMVEFQADYFDYWVKGKLKTFGDISQSISATYSMNQSFYTTNEYYLDNEWKDIQPFQGVETVYTGTKTLNLSERYRVASGKDAIRRLHKYETENGDDYILDDQGRFYTYSNFNLIDLETENSNNEIQRIDIGEEEVVKKIYEFLEEKVNNLDSYRVFKIEKEDSFYDYQISLKNDNQDEIKCNMYSNGNIYSIFCNYNDIEELTEEKENYFDNEFKKYLEKYQEEVQNYNNYEVMNLAYKKVDGKIYAFYQVKFEDVKGACFAESIAIEEK